MRTDFKLAKIGVEQKPNVLCGRKFPVINDGVALGRQVESKHSHVARVPERDACGDRWRLRSDFYLAVDWIRRFE